MGSVRGVLPNNDVLVRRAEAGDVPALAELNRFVQDFHRAHEPAVYTCPEPADVAAWFITQLDSGNVRMWVATVREDVVGYVAVLLESWDEHLFCRARAWREVDQIGVHPNWRRRGIARALLRVVAEDAERDGVDRLLLSSWSFNTVAQEAWRHLGFEPQSTYFKVDPRRLRE
jgi:ribosomal protein S18 acetylase RimI-like enzyme